LQIKERNRRKYRFTKRRLPLMGECYLKIVLGGFSPPGGEGLEGGDVPQGGKLCRGGELDSRG